MRAGAHQLAGHARVLDVLPVRIEDLDFHSQKFPLNL